MIMDTDRYDNIISENESDNQELESLKDKFVNNLKKSGYFKCPDNIFGSGLSPKAKLVLVYLCRRADKKGRSFPSKNRIAKDCGFSKRTADKAVDELIIWGIVKVNPIRGTSNRYFLDDSIIEVLQLDNHESLSEEGSYTSMQQNSYAENTPLHNDPPAESAHTPANLTPLPVQELHPKENTKKENTEKENL